MSMNEIAKDITTWRISNGFYTPPTLNTENERDLMLGKLMLIASEVGETAEAVRHNDFPNFAEELADIIIRVFDICSTTGIDIEHEVEQKMCSNKQRPFKHNKHCSL